jgi:hypothetical protein
MAMPSSGEIGMRLINVELRRASCVAQISLDTAENGGYGAINQNSRSRPNASNPAALSEWYGYDHRARPPAPTYVPLPEVGYAGSTSTAGRALDDACRNSVFRPGRYWGREENLVATASTSDFYTNSGGTAFPPAGFYAQFGAEAIYWNGSAPTRIEACRI